MTKPEWSPYATALEAAGAKVKAFRSFGSYQGDWWALVVFKGKTRWVHGSYGSCSGCDAFEGEFGSLYLDFSDRNAIANIQKRLSEFGARLLGDLFTQVEAEKLAGECVEWDAEAPAMLAFVQSRGK